MPPTTEASTSKLKGYEKEIAATAYVSRIFLIVLQYAANHLIPDHNAHVFTYVTDKNTTAFDQLVDHLLGGFVRWDAHYFMHIARYGYTYEHTLAFFPLYPTLGGLITKVLSPLLYFMSADSILLLGYTFINILIFKRAALVLFRLTGIFFNPELAYVAARIFCFNPASVFFSAPYTETVFSFLSFTAMYNCIKWYQGQQSLETVLLPIALSGVTRSNGLLNAGYCSFAIVCLALKDHSDFYNICKHILKFTVTAVISISLFLYFTAYSWGLFCTGYLNMSLAKELQKQAQVEHYVLPFGWTNQSRPWCHSFTLPYTYVQDHYWNVGFLKYFHLKQIPNFLLALPILYIVISSCFEHFCINLLKRKCFNIFTLENPPKGKIPKDDLWQPRLNVFYAHALFLSVFCFFFVNVQISTRILCSASPVFYWVCSVKAYKSPLAKVAIRWYILGYFIIGTLMFCNFLPWT